MCCGLEIILERIKVTFLSKPAKFGQAQTAKLLIGDTELKGVPESCLRGSRAAWPDVGLIDKEPEDQTKEVAVSFGRRVVGPGWL